MAAPGVHRSTGDVAEAFRPVGQQPCGQGRHLGRAGPGVDHDVPRLVGLGQCSILATSNSKILGLQHAWNGRTVITLHNFDEHAQTARLRLKSKETTLSNLRVPLEVHASDNGRFEIVLDALNYCWFRVGGLDYAAKREGKLRNGWRLGAGGWGKNRRF